MKLLWSSRSPFVRKVMIVLREKNLEDAVELQGATVMLTAVPAEDVLALNPLGKIPALIRDDGSVLYDSRVICEYLDLIGEGPGLLPGDAEQRLVSLRRQATGDGLLDILLLWRTEFGRGDAAHPGILLGLEAKVRAVMKSLETEADSMAAAPFCLGQISILCALGHLDFRYGACNWRAAHPRLAQWEAGLRDRPSVAETAPGDEGDNVMGSVEMPLSFQGEA
jgi:glutathione S-transferase